MKKHLAILKNIKTIKNKEHFFILGKGQNYHIAQEGALKIKEISYKHFEGFAAGELKHGVIALIEKGTLLFLLFQMIQITKI
jgi:glucosamine--fructose-6-phosphate aminotransferase (isomerizing)